MDTLLAFYKNMFKDYEGTFTQIFSKFYTLDLSPIDSWLVSKFNNKMEKNDSISKLYRMEGNNYYGLNDCVKSLEYYTKSLCYAIPSGREYSIALANRSAVSFQQKEFEDCLKDINLCLNLDYPINLRPKVYFRKALCYLKTGQEQNFEKCLTEISNFLSSSNVNDKKTHFEKLQEMKMKQVKQRNEHFNNDATKLPEFEEGENINFAYASSKIKMSYDKARGRHVIAEKKIDRGDILFIEKAFVFAPIFKENKDFHPCKCYNCLRDVISSIPCKSCTLCVYCDETCRMFSWDNCHRWECAGMQANIWYDLGIAFPALRAILKGARENGLSISSHDHMADLKDFGNRNNNYPYFNKLCTNLTKKSKNLVSYVTMGAIVVTYLKKHTEFFTWFLKEEHHPADNMDGLVNHVGGFIAKHIAQFACNSSIIEHWAYPSTDEIFPNDLVSVACGIFPSVSIMNHSCRPNITNFFIHDTIIVKALEDISENGEILNCYGIDYRSMKREERQLACQELYGFKCRCIICQHPTSEVDMLDSYLCCNCKGQVPDSIGGVIGCCVNCGQEHCLEPLRLYNKNAHGFLEVDSDVPEGLLKSLEVKNKCLYKYHKDFEQVYFRLYRFFLRHEDVGNLFKYFHLWLEYEKGRSGESSRGVGLKLFEGALAILHCLQRNHHNYSNLKGLLENIEYIIREAKIVLNLYYPEHLTNRMTTNIKITD